MKRKPSSILLALVLVAGFSLITAVPAAADGTTLSVSRWTESPAPVFDPAAKAYYPTVVKVSDTDYRMWYGSDSGIGYATSLDGISWLEVENPVTGLTNANHPLVEYADGRYMIWYWNTGESIYSIGTLRYAESTDGTTWTDDQALTQDDTYRLVTGSGTGWSSGSYGPGDVIYNPGGSETLDDGDVWHNKYVMYYMATDGGKEYIGLAYSVDGKHWKRYGDDPVLSPCNGDPSAGWDYVSVGYPTVIKGASGKWYMWFSGGPGTNHGIGQATSGDGLTWTKGPENPYLHRDDGVPWRAERTYTPMVIADDGAYKMWFSGKDATGNYAIGYATNTNPDADYKTIQDAVDAANPGDTIKIAAGTYNPTSTTVINKNDLVIEGPQAGVEPRPSYGSARTAGSTSEAIIDGGPGNLGVIIEIDADNVVINGLEVKSGTGDMIKQNQPHSGTAVKYCIIHDGLGDEGVQLKKCTGGVLEYNYVFEIADPGDGLNIADSSSNGTIRYNEVAGIHGENAAIYIYGAEHMEIIGNLVRDSGSGGNDGIKVGSKDGSDATKRDVLLKDNIIHDITQDGISVYMSGAAVAGNEIYGCHSENGAIYVAFAVGDITIIGNSVHDNSLDTGKWGDPGAIMVGTGVDVATVRVNCNNLYSNTPFGVTNKAEGELDATNNWWETKDGTVIATMVSGNVNYDPWTGAEMEKAKSEETAPGDYIVDARDEAGIEVEKLGTGTPTVTVAQYCDNPGCCFSGDTGKYIDVNIDDASDVTELTIRLYYTDAEISELDDSSLRLQWWDGAEWITCSDSGVDETENYMWARIRADTIPNLSQLTGTPFGGQGDPSPLVGGIIYPSSKLALLAPWITLGLATTVGTIMLTRRRRLRGNHWSGG
jgi:hypothetical protein